MLSENHDCDRNVHPNMYKYGGMNCWRWNIGVGAQQCEIPLGKCCYTFKSDGDNSVKRYHSLGKRVAPPARPHIYGNFQTPHHCCRLPDELLGWSPAQIRSYACLAPSPQQCTREPLPMPDAQIQLARVLYMGILVQLWQEKQEKLRSTP